jgi:bifunctional DNA-binding transcriptional regulator/antitoxin component of YhaV-PrlF toxin-antitoxin module
MEIITTQVSEHGQVMLPEFIRQAHNWLGQELIILNIR